ncbi:FAD/NAD(P)-binding domain-containing protein [Thozetella sp. PMI_491]|nr:FAD/NAD(P)-binding domain-containing protein [Thozetella sp. PMI_491]
MTANHALETKPVQANGSEEASASYQVREQPLGAKKHLRIVGIGAGASGLNLVRTLRLNLTDYELVIYEKNSDVGGTWFENRYPGCRCDVPSHNYQFSWRPKKDWSNFFAPAPEIEDYLRQLCDDEGMRDSVKTSHKVTAAVWNEEKGVWDLTVENEAGEPFADYAHFLLNGSGILNNWKWPDLPGLESFGGELIHTANWPADFDASGKTILVIGNGSSGVQVLPELQRTAKKIYHPVRTPTWVIPPRIQSWQALGQAGEVLSKIELNAKEDFSQATIEKFESDPEFYRYFVKGIEKEINNVLPILIKDGPMQAFARAKVAEYMTAVLRGDEKLCKALIPDYPLGCRRMTPGHQYLAALTQPNVEVFPTTIKQLNADSVELESGEVLKVDAVVCATGFETSFRPRFPIVGRNGNLQDIWKEELPKAYLSCAVAGLPNYFVFLGPNAPIGHGSVFTITEHVAKYITGVIKKCQTEDIKALAPSQGAVDDFFEHITAFMPRAAWSGSCRSWFKGGKADGPVTALHPGSRVHFFHMLERFRGEDFEYVFDNARQNRFAYLGNGFSTKELGPKSDSTWYLDDPSAAAFQ